MKPTISAGRKKRKSGRKVGGRRRGGGMLPSIGHSPPRAQQGRLSLPSNTRTTPRKIGSARHVKTSPELTDHLPELEHRMADAVQNSSDAIADLRRSMGIATPAAPGRGRPPRYRSVSTHGPSSARRAQRHGSGPSEGKSDGEGLREAYGVLLERTEVLANELEELREQERQQKASASTVAPPGDAKVGELERLRALIAGLEKGVQTSSAQLELLRGRFDEEVQAKAMEVEAAVRKAEQNRVDELERALKVSSSTNATMESALADMKKQEMQQAKRRVQSDYGEADVIDEVEDAIVPTVAAGDVTVGEVDQLRLAWTKAFARRSAAALVKLFAPSGRLQGSLSTVAKRDAAPFSGASALLEYFNGFFQRFPLVKVQGGMLQSVEPQGLQAIAKGTAVWSTVAELHLYDHPQDVTFKTANVSFVFTLGRLVEPDQGNAVQILSQHCVATALAKGGANDESKLSARSGVSGKQSARDGSADAQSLSAKQLLDQRAERQAAQKQRRELIAAKRQQRAIEEEEARRAQEKADHKATVAARKHAHTKRQMNAAGNAATPVPKTGTYAVKGSQKMQHRLAEVEVKAMSAQNSRQKSLPQRPSVQRPSPRKVSPRKIKKKSPRSSAAGKSGALGDAALAAKKSARKQAPQRELANFEATRGVWEEREWNDAASKLQARQRGRVARKHVAVQKSQMNGAASMLQARQRGRVARRHVAVQKSQMNSAASMLQARQRGRVARRHLTEQRTEMNRAASKLQARARGRITRKEIAQRKAELAVVAAQQAAAVAAAAVAAAKEGEAGLTEGEEAYSDAEAYSDDNYEDDFSDDFEDETESGFVTETPELPAGDADQVAPDIANGWEAREHAAAAVLQARQRGRATRKNVAARRSQARADRLEQEGAARQIQARQRGKLARQEASRRKEARRAAAAVEAAQVNANGDDDDEVAYQDDYDEDFSDFESEGAPTPVPKSVQADGGNDELEAAARRIQARQRGKRARQEIREQHRAAAKMQAVHRGRAARQRQAAKQQKAAEAVEAAREASLLAAALVEIAQDAGEEEDYGDDFDEDDDGDASLDVDELWQQMENAGDPIPAAAKATPVQNLTSPEPAPFVPGEEFGELTAMPAIESIKPTTGKEDFLSPTPSMREEVPSLGRVGLGTPSTAAKEEAESASVAAAPIETDDADDNYSDYDDEFGSLDAEDIWDQPVMKADPLVPAYAVQ